MCKLSVLIPTYNCAESVKATLESVAWADEIVIVDSYSTDNTLDVVKKYTSKIYQRVYDTPSQQKNWALQYCSHDWVLQLDSDETIESKLINEIISVIESENSPITYFKIPRKNIIIGKLLKNGGLYPDYQPRLFRKSKSKFNKRVVHEGVETTGKTGLLEHAIIHESTPNISKLLSNLDRYTDYEAQEMLRKGKSFSYFRWIAVPTFIFVKTYFFRKGLFDGWRGLILAIYNFFYHFISYAKLKEHNYKSKLK